MSPSATGDSPRLDLVRWRRGIGLALACYWILLFISTHMPMPRLPRLLRHSDKGMHFGAYAGLAFLLGLWLAASRPTRPLRWQQFLLVFLSTAAFGAINELLQIPVGRRADIYDWMANCAGAAAGLAALFTMLTASSLAPFRPDEDATGGTIDQATGELADMEYERLRLQAGTTDPGESPLPIS